jgi:hypothetical protein
MNRISVLCVAAVFTTGALLAASASAALPEFTGPFPKAFTANSGRVSLETVGKVKATCAASTQVGEMLGPNTGTATLRSSGCEAVGLKCTTAGAAAGEIVTSVLSVSLGYINRTNEEVGLDAASPPTGAPFARFACGPFKIVVTGSVIGKITPIRKKVQPAGHFALKLTQAKGKQKPSKFEGGPTDVLESSVNGMPFEEEGVSLKAQVRFTEVVEIKA